MYNMADQIHLSSVFAHPHACTHTRTLSKNVALYSFGFSAKSWSL